ncbi:TIGR03086 family metal-binding protein [Pseudonocardia sp. H11422]|uniref:TIGR03086 family metal-binding protein n=1 Tax=Pseudonocardia sp. H11422 TaxID=2835866 RepID=UPI001BDBB8AC|nr:TIGR03086 family metal-binding protein [Pseudonocardia sp. H11422]
MDHADHLQQSIDIAVAAIRGARPEQFDDPSPCSDYTVGRVVNHLAFGFLLAQRSGARREWDASWSADERAPFLIDVPEGRWADVCAREAAETARIWTDPQVWEGDTDLGGSTMPAAMVGSIMTSEFVIHAWDVAAATGQRIECPPGLGEAVLEGASGIAQMGRDGGWFGAEVAVDSSAPAFDRALGVTGRDPRWAPRRS